MKTKIIYPTCDNTLRVSHVCVQVKPTVIGVEHAAATLLQLVSGVWSGSFTQEACQRSICIFPVQLHLRDYQSPPCSWDRRRRSKTSIIVWTIYSWANGGKFFGMNSPESLHQKVRSLYFQIDIHQLWWPSGEGVGLEIQWGFPTQVRTLLTAIWIL